jgi:trimethylamine-N-oxide reductase (cytochrome c)
VEYDGLCSWIDAIPYHRVTKDGYKWWPIRINPADAKERNITGGDIVEVYNDRGSVLCVAQITERVPQGVTHSYGCSSRYDPLVPGKAGSSDRGGCINLLTSSRLLSKRAPGMTPNSCLCEIRKWEG